MRDLRQHPEAAPEELTRKRFVRRQWARRWGVWRYVLLAALAIGALVAGVWLIFFSSVLAVTGVDVEGNRLLSEEEIARAAAVPTGEPLARADLDAIRARVEALPAVESVDVSRQWPDQVRVEVDEREAVAVVVLDDRYRGLDANGVVFRDYPRPPRGLPVIRIAPDTRGEAMAEGAAVVGVLPAEITRQIEYVELVTVDEISLQLRNGDTVVWGSSEDAGDKARVLAALLQQDGTVYDVSVPGHPTIR